MTTYNIHDLAYSKGVPEPVREALLGMQSRIQDLYRQIETLEKQLDDQYKLGMEAEREACAKLLQSRKTGANELMDAVRDMEARVIRARGQA